MRMKHVAFIKIPFKYSMQIDPEKFEGEINDFFDIGKKVPDIFIDGHKLREEYYRREKRLKEISNCYSCEILQFRAFFIEKLLENIKFTIDV